MNEFSATARFQRIAATRVRDVSKLIRGKNVLVALDILSGVKNKGALLLTKIIRSARSNALHLDEQKRLSVNADRLVISSLMIDEGPTQHRWRPMSMGRAGRIRKRTSHVTVVLKEPAGEIRMGEA